MLGYTLGNTTFTITSNRKLDSRMIMQTWMTVTPASGSNDGTLTVTYQENTTHK